MAARQSTSRAAAKHAVSDAEALRLVTEMMAIPGRSGKETAIIEFIRQHLLGAGASPAALRNDNAHRRSIHGGEVGNLVLKLPGTVRAPRRMLVAHTDTVPVCIGSRPIRKGGRIVSADRTTGVGADDRTGSAVLLTTALAILRGGLPHPPLTFLWAVQEETGLHGVRHAQLGLLGRPRLSFNFDGGTPSKITIGATGAYRLAIDVRGIASHAGGAPAEGVSAIAIASLAIADLVKQGWFGQISKGRHVGTSNVGVIHGGEATNVMTEHVEIRAEARSHDPKFRRQIVREIGRAFGRAARQVRNTAGRGGAVHVASRPDYESFRLAADEPCVVAAAGAARAEGVEPELAISNGGLDANWLTARGIPTVTLGCGQKNIHTIAEELVIDDFQLARRIALRLATDAESL
jgi:tripeptide aminopeptidase